MKLNTILLFFIFIGFQNNFLFAQPPGTTNAQKIKWLKEHGKLKGLPSTPQGSIYQYANKTAFVPYNVQFDLTYTITSTFDTIYYEYDSNAQKTLRQHHKINSVFSDKINATCDTLYGTTKTVGDDIYYDLTTNSDEKGKFKDKKFKVTGNFSLISNDESENEVEQTKCNEQRHIEKKSEKWNMNATGDVFDENSNFQFNYEVLKDNPKSQGELNYMFVLNKASGTAIKETECDGKTDLIAATYGTGAMEEDGKKSTFPKEKYIAGLMMSGFNGNALQGFLSEKTAISNNNGANQLFDAAMQANEKLGKIITNGAFITKTKRGFILEKAANIEAKKGNATTSINWHLSASLSDKPMKYEAILSPVDKETYTNWLPKGPKPEGNGQEKDVNRKPRGNDIAFKIIVRDKATKELATMPWKAKFYLTENSHYKGWCTNYPVKSDDETPDLRFVSNDAAQRFEYIDDTSAITIKSVQDKNVTLICYDYAAYANLNADVTMEDGTKIETHVEDHSDSVSTLTIPLDDNGNHIADAWEKNKPFDGKPPTWDEDPKPAKQKRNGDGYTMFEEYRGFIVLKEVGNLPPNPTNKEFIRLDPNTKDCFVYDQTDSFFKYYAPTNIAQVQWHYLDKTLFEFKEKEDSPETNWMNYNTPNEYAYAKQYALYLFAEEYKGDFVGEAGETVPRKGFPGNGHHGLYCHFSYAASVAEANIFLGHCSDPAKIAAMAERDFNQTVLHEVGHFIGINHHSRLQYNDKTDGFDDEWSRFFGVHTCVMRYYSASDQRLVETTCALAPSLNHYCTADETAIDRRGGATPSDNCWGQIDVKSDP